MISISAGSDSASGSVAVMDENHSYQAIETILNSLDALVYVCLLYTSPSPRDVEESRMPSSA